MVLSILACKQTLLPAGKTMLAGQLCSTSGDGGFVVEYIRDTPILVRVAVFDVDA
jgi:hypothetical protein